MRGNVLDELTWLVALTVIAPYIIRCGKKYKNKRLILIGVLIIVLKLWNFYAFGSNLRLA